MDFRDLPSWAKRQIRLYVCCWCKVERGADGLKSPAPSSSRNSELGGFIARLIQTVLPLPSTIMLVLMILCHPDGEIQLAAVTAAQGSRLDLTRIPGTDQGRSDIAVGWDQSPAGHCGNASRPSPGQAGSSQLKMPSPPRRNSAAVAKVSMLSMA